MALEGKKDSSKIILHDKKRVIKKSKTTANAKVITMKSRIKEMGPICKSRKKYEKDSPESKPEQKDEGFVWLCSEVNQHEPLWLSSESGDFNFMSPSDDERLISFLSSYGGINFFDDSNANSIKEDSSSNHGSSSTTTLSKCSDSSSLFWDLDRTDMWSSLINLDGEDCKWISNVESDSENLESNFPSPTSYEDKRSSEVDVSSSMKSIHDELSSEILSGSLDLDDIGFDEPLMWPSDDEYDSCSTSDFFCQSPCRGFGTSTALLKNDVRRKVHSKEWWWNRRFVAASSGLLSACKFFSFKRRSRRIVIASRNTKLNRFSRNSKMMLSASKLGKKKHKFRKGNLFISAKRLEAMSLFNMDEFNLWPDEQHSSKHSTSSHDEGSSVTSTRFDDTGLWVSLIDLNEEDSQWNSKLETEWEEGLDSNFPSPSYQNRRNQRVLWSSENGVSFQDERCLEIFSDQMDEDELVFWPYTKDQNWNMVWDSFCTPLHIIGNSESIRVRIQDQREGFKRRAVAMSGLRASKNNGFKRGYVKKGNATRAKAMNWRFGKSVAGKVATNVAKQMEVIKENDVEGGAVDMTKS